MKLRHNPENINACYCPCHEDSPVKDHYTGHGVGVLDDEPCERCGLLICPCCTQVVPMRLIPTVLALDDAGRLPRSN